VVGRRDPVTGTDVRMTAQISGIVQGVGFRWWTRCRALELGLVGCATNLGDGRVEVIAEGSRQACDGLLELLRGPTTPGHVVAVDVEFGSAQGGFVRFVER
jgi:acylphosphatase